jgi:branched-chain amino acid transport system substrate-binding protein
MKYKYLLLGVFLSVCLVISACAAPSGGTPTATTGTASPTSSTQAGVIKVGLNAELTGSIPKVGKSCKQGAELAVKEVNDAGGLEVAGQKYKIQLYVEDNEDKGDVAASVTQKLITQYGVLAVIGPNASRNAIPASEIAESAQVPLIGPWPSNPKFTINSTTGEPKKWVFRLFYLDSDQGPANAKFVKEEFNASKVAILYAIDSDYNKGMAEFFSKAFEKLGGQVVAYESYSTADKNFTSQLTKIKAANPDVVFLPNYYNEVALQLQQAHQLGINAIFMTTDASFSSELLTLGGKDVEGLYLYSTFITDAASANPVAKKFIDSYRAAYGEDPDDVAALTYDSFGLLFQAIQSAGKIDRQAVRDALATPHTYKGVTGDTIFKGTGDPIKNIYWVQVKDGQFRVYIPKNYKP